MQNINKQMQIQFDKMMSTGNLFKTNALNVWETYLNSFNPKHNPKFRDPNSSVHNCNCCKRFVRRYGNIVAIGEQGLMTIWDIEVNEEYTNSFKACRELIGNSKIENIFLESYYMLKEKLKYEENCSTTQSSYLLGVPSNKKRYTKAEAELYGVVKPNEIRTFHHLNLKLNRQFINFNHKSANFVNIAPASIEFIQSETRTNKEVLDRMLEEVHKSTFKLMIELIQQDSLLSSSQYIKLLKEFVKLKKEYKATSNKEHWLWLKSIELGRTSKFYNTLQGTFLKEITEGVELQKACNEYNRRIDPTNYGKARKAFSEGMKKALMKELKALGIEEKAFIRRHATIEDIDISEIKHINMNTSVKEASLFDKLNTHKPHSKHKKSDFDKVEEVTIEKFMKDILPECDSVEAFLENRMENNLCNLTTATNNTNNIFKYSNLFSKTFNGNLAGKSNIKENVKSAGGKIDGVLRFSIQWNDEDTKGILDFDAHAVEPDGSEIFFMNYKGKSKSPMSGNLDVDMINPANIGVENIIWTDKSKMKDGDYKLFIRNYNRGKNTGFKAEIEFENEVFNYHYKSYVERDISVAIVTLKNGVFSIKHLLPETNFSETIYNLETNKFHKVNLVCLSPNYWGKNNIGIKHYMFMLENCKTEKSIVGFHTEDLLPTLAKNNAGMRDLAYITMIEPSDKQLAGLGFNASVRDELIVKVTGAFKRMLKIKF